jgi:hypothetical protein
MSTVKESARARGRRGRAEATAPNSIREVSLVGGPPLGWAEGDRVALAGRSYHVVETGRYAHLRIEPIGPSLG